MTKFMRIRIEQSFTKTAICPDEFEVGALDGDVLVEVSAEVESEIKASAPSGTSSFVCRVVSAEIIEVP